MIIVDVNGRITSHADKSPELISSAEKSSGTANADSNNADTAAVMARNALYREDATSSESQLAKTRRSRKRAE